MARRTDRAVRIDGLDEFRRSLARAGVDTKKAIGEANRKVGGLVVDEAKARAPRAPNARQAAAAAASLRAASQQARVLVRLGSSRIPFALGAEHGSDRFRQFPAHKGKGGYWFWPAVEALRPEIADSYLDRIEQAARQAFPD